MRTLFFISVALLGFISLNAQTGTKTFTLNVKGNCEECKTRIENASDIKGVKLCNWDEKTKVATITYRPDKVSPAEIEKAIAASGHDAGQTKSDDKKYFKLPKCCQYRHGKCEE